MTKQEKEMMVLKARVLELEATVSKSSFSEGLSVVERNAYAFMEKEMMHRAIRDADGIYPLWHKACMIEAFLAGDHNACMRQLNR